MSQHPNEIPADRASQLLRWLVAGAGLAGALAALAQPGGSADTAEIASVLAIGALALFAGHAWGMLVVVFADVVLLGQVWPMAVYQDPPSLAAQVAAYTAVAGALPGLLLFARIVPGTVDFVLGPRSSRLLRTSAIALATAASGAWLLTPAL